LRKAGVLLSRAVKIADQIVRKSEEPLEDVARINAGARAQIVMPPPRSACEPREALRADGDFCVRAGRRVRARGEGL
jgi:hypothetical protein